MLNSVQLKFEATEHLCRAVLSAAYSFPVTASDTGEGPHKSPLDQVILVVVVVVATAIVVVIIVVVVFVAVVIVVVMFCQRS